MCEPMPNDELIALVRDAPVGEFQAPTPLPCPGFRQRLARALMHSGLSPGQLDARMQWRRGWTKGLLSGRLEPPPPTVVSVLSQVLRVSYAWLWSGKIDEVAKARLRDAEKRLTRIPLGDRQALLELLEML